MRIFKRWFNRKSNIYCQVELNKQLLDEVEHDIKNYQNRGLCYLPKPKAEADNTDTRYIFHIIHPQKQKRSVQPFCF